MPDQTYPYSELLVSASWLGDHLKDSPLKILDARSAEEYAEGHIPGAVPLPPRVFRAAGGVADVCSAEEFAASVGALGISISDVVVCYDTAGPAGARAWWAFAHFGHPDVRFLNGGFRQWLAGGHAISTEIASPRPTNYALGRKDDQLACSLEGAVGAVGDDAVLFWDVRTADEYSGVNPRNNPPERAGHLPEAVHLEWSELVDSATGLFKPADEMERTLGAKGITPEKRVVAY